MLSLLKYLKPYRIPLLCLVAVNVVQSLAALYLPLLMAQLVDAGIASGSFYRIAHVAGVMLAVAVVGAICSAGAAFLSAKVSAGFAMTLRQEIFGRVASLSFSEYGKIDTPSLITRTINDVSQVQGFLMTLLQVFITSVLLCFGGVLLAFAKDVILSLIFLVAIPLLAVVFSVIAGRSLPHFVALQGMLDRVNLILREKLEGVRVIRAFQRESHEEERFQEVNERLTDTAITANRIQAGLLPSLSLFFGASAVAILWLGALLVAKGTLAVGVLMMFIQYDLMIMISVFMASTVLLMMPRASASAARINEVLALRPEECAGDRPLPATGRVEFRGVTFSYPGAERPALRDISFCAGRGEVICIVGGTGAGKSTLLNLIPRFYELGQGSILMHGVDVREVSLEELRAGIGLVPQRSLLFSGSVAENVCYGKEGATEAEVRNALDAAQAEWLLDAEGGLEYAVQQGGRNLSGGQKQRLSIARALVRKPTLYLLDDSFSALDAKTGADLGKALRKAATDATVLMVSRRALSTLEADRIIVMDEGRIVGQGRHHDLLENCEVYRELNHAQPLGEVPIVLEPEPANYHTELMEEGKDHDNHQSWQRHP